MLFPFSSAITKQARLRYRPCLLSSHGNTTSIKCSLSLLNVLYSLQRARHVTASRDIRQRIEKRLDAWEVRRFAMLVEDTLRSSTQYLTAVRREETAEHQAKTFHGLLLRSKLQTAVRRITEREKGGVLLPEEQCTKTGDRVLEVLHPKHPDARPVCRMP